MTLRIVPFVGLAIVGALSDVEATQFQQAQSAGVPRFEVTPPRRPAQPLFPVQPFESPAPLPQARPLPPPANPLPAPSQQPRVVCGMTLIPAPDVEPGRGPAMQEREKPKAPTTFTIRPVQPSICW